MSPDTASDGPLIGGRYASASCSAAAAWPDPQGPTPRPHGGHQAASHRPATSPGEFRREARAPPRSTTPAIVAVYDTGEVPASDGSNVSQPYIVMEYVAGRTLRDILREGRKILPERALEIASGVLSALDYSHRAGIIHRDIKPGNVMLTPSGDVKVMDFGIARAISDASSTMTQTAAVVGTAQYLSPEQARMSRSTRARRLLRGLPVCELLTGKPFIGDPMAVAYQHPGARGTPSDHDTDLPPEVDATMKSLAKAWTATSRPPRCGRHRALPRRSPGARHAPRPRSTHRRRPARPGGRAVTPAGGGRPRHRPGLLVFLAILLVIVLG